MRLGPLSLLQFSVFTDNLLQHYFQIHLVHGQMKDLHPFFLLATQTEHDRNGESQDYHIETHDFV